MELGLWWLIQSGPRLRGRIVKTCATADIFHTPILKEKHPGIVYVKLERVFLLRVKILPWDKRHRNKCTRLGWTAVAIEVTFSTHPGHGLVWVMYRAMVDRFGPKCLCDNHASGYFSADPKEVLNTHPNLDFAPTLLSPSLVAVGAKSRSHLCISNNAN